ncbi:hypothetical protein AMECASPLE_033154 [Ameca splendens]|uniref:Cysteine and glycine-rich protein n=1 Tax=Ameca splendens TaxID=208324 RepID=A0ABV0ZGW9_9TELE
MSGPTKVKYQSGLYGGNHNKSSSSPLSSRGNSPIMCERCREACRGEVVRVKNTHFHVHCFTCQDTSSSSSGGSPRRSQASRET